MNRHSSGTGNVLREINADVSHGAPGNRDLSGSPAVPFLGKRYASEHEADGRSDPAGFRGFYEDCVEVKLTQVAAD